VIPKVHGHSELVSGRAGLKDFQGDEPPSVIELTREPHGAEPAVAELVDDAVEVRVVAEDIADVDRVVATETIFFDIFESVKWRQLIRSIIRRLEHTT
jgi:hypothetical protein